MCEVGDDETWHDISSNLAMKDSKAGILHWKQMPGQYLQTIQIRYAGGYFIDTTSDLTGTPPTRQTSLPADIILAWTQLVQEVWTRSQQRLLTTPDSAHVPHPTEFPQIVRDILAPYRRLAA